ncbi:fibropellin-1-like isoform X1, partial [Paramuricea clavata]
LCQVPILYYANSSTIDTYNTKAGNLSSNFFLRSPDSQLVYDKHNRQILIYASGTTLSRVTLDGSNITTLATDEEHIRRFTYDGRRNIIYYIHDARDAIHMLNLTNMQDNEIGALALISNIQDLDIDVLNDCLVIVTASNLSIVLYDLRESSSVRVITYDGGSGQSLYVFEDGTIYWVIYNPSTGRFIILCTSKAGVTRNLGIWYNGEIRVVVDRLYIYVLDKDNNRIDIYSRRTLMKLGELPVPPSVCELILAFDIDECCSNNTCHMNATCSDTPGSFVCTCNEGFEPSGDDCLDINECDRGYCDPNADCVNSQGSFYCTCRSGFVGNGLNCTETCEDEILFYSTSSRIISNSSVSIPTADNNILGYDKYNRRLLYYDDTENLYSVGLNGLNSTVLINKAYIAEFAYDGERGVLYYLNRLTLKINSVNISNGEDAPVQALDSYSDIKGMEMDTKNRYLVIAKSSLPPIVRLDIISFETQEINFDGSAQALSVDQDNEVVYWVNFVVSTDKHYLMRSSYTGETVPLNVSYDGEIDLAQDYMHLYVLDKENDRIDKYNKRTWVEINVFNINDGPQRLIIAFGE